jgi:hypothetical protein
MSDGSASPREMFGNVVQVGAVVKDLERAIQVLSEVFGIGPFRVHQLASCRAHPPIFKGPIAGRPAVLRPAWLSLSWDRLNLN